jgi:hypothetical protein
MNDYGTLAVVFCYILFLGVIAAILVYLIVKRIAKKGNEGFEERDN